VLLRWLTWIVLIMLPISAWSQWHAVGDQGWQSVVLRTAAGMVGLIPEGLVVLTTLAFLLAAVQLTRKQALVQELPAVELLARVDVICVDKTGTLTEGQIGFESLTVLDGESDEVVRQVVAALAHDTAGNQTSNALAPGVPRHDPPGHRARRVLVGPQVERWRHRRTGMAPRRAGCAAHDVRGSGPRRPGPRLVRRGQQGSATRSR